MLLRPVRISRDVTSTSWPDSIGRALERSIALAGALAALAEPDAPEGALDLAVEIGDSVMSHRRRYAVTTTRETVIDLLALDAMNPRAILFQLDGIRDQVALLPDAVRDDHMSDLSRAVLRCHTGLVTQRPETLASADLWALYGQIAGLSDLLSQNYLR